MSSATLPFKRNDARRMICVEQSHSALARLPKDGPRSAVGKFSAPASEDKPHPVAIDFDNGRRVDPNHKVAVHSHLPFVRGECWHGSSVRCNRFSANPLGSQKIVESIQLLARAA